jgi:hypothetical protein
MHRSAVLLSLLLLLPGCPRAGTEGGDPACTDEHEPDDEFDDGPEHRPSDLDALDLLLCSGDVDTFRYGVGVDYSTWFSAEWEPDDGDLDIQVQTVDGAPDGQPGVDDGEGQARFHSFLTEAILRIRRLDDGNEPLAYTLDGFSTYDGYCE